MISHLQQATNRSTLACSSPKYDHRTKLVISQSVGVDNKRVKKKGNWTTTTFISDLIALQSTEISTLLYFDDCAVNAVE